MPRQPRLDAPEDYTMWWGGGLRVQKYSGRIGIGRIPFLDLESGGEDGISGCGGSAVSGCTNIGGNPSGLFGGTAWTPKASVSSFSKHVPFPAHGIIISSMKIKVPLLTLPFWTLVFGVFPKNATFQIQILNLDLETKTIFKGKGNFVLDCRSMEEYFVINYSYLFLVNQQSAPWPSGVEDEKEFPEGSHTKFPWDFLFLWRHISYQRLQFALVLSSLDNNKTIRDPKSG